MKPSVREAIDARLSGVRMSPVTSFPHKYIF